MATYDNGSGLQIDIEESDINPNVSKGTVPRGTQPPSWVQSISRGFPSADLDTWYFTNSAFNFLDKLDAFTQTASEIPGRAADVFNDLNDTGKWIVGGLVALVVLEILKRTK